MVYDRIDLERLKSYQELERVIEKVKHAMEEVGMLRHPSGDGFESEITEGEKKVLKRLIANEFKPFAEEIKDVKRKLR